jgi:uncharacterized protein YqeY
VDVEQRLMEDMQDAMRRGERQRRETIRMLRAALHNEQVARRGPLDEPAAIEVLSRELKKRQEALVMFRQGGRQDLVEQAERDIALIGHYLPGQMSPEELEAAARQAIAEAGVTDPRQMGQVMRLLAPRIKGRADGRLAGEMVRRLLGEGG